MHGRKLLVSILAGVLLISATSDRPTSDLERLRGEIARLRATLDSVTSRAKSTEQELEAIDLQIEIHSRELEMATSVAGDLAAQQAGVETQMQRTTDQIAREKKYLVSRLTTLYKFGMLSYVRLLLAFNSRENPFDAVQMLAYLVERDSRAVNDFEKLRLELEKQKADLADKRQRVAKAQALVVERRNAVASTRAEKAALLARLQSQSYRSAQQLAALEEKARRLEKLVTLLYEKKGAQQMQGTSVADFKGALDWPVRGRVIEGFGKHRSTQFATFTMSNGLKIEAPPGTEVHAVFAGTVLYAQWFKGYGNLVIVDHGNRVFSLYGNNRSTGVAAGQKVFPGQTIGTVGDNEDMTGGYLYFEIREDNKPTDPRNWLR